MNNDFLTDDEQLEIMEVLLECFENGEIGEE